MAARGLHKTTVFALIALSALCVVAAAFVDFYVDGSGPSNEEKHVLIPKGSSVNRIGQILAEDEVIRSPLLFKATYYLLFKDDALKAGEYLFHSGITPREILFKMSEGDIFYRQLTIPEGLTTAEILALVEKAEHLKGLSPIDINEGELMPETYNYSAGDTRAELIERMYISRYSIFEKLWETRKSDLPFKTKEEAVILASIVEKETGVADERGRVAAVFVNRLRKKMKLQSDPTVIYALTKGEKPLERELRKKDLKVNSPYNTYLHKGLPPGPICHPGKESLAAVLNPPESKEYYFVADGNGGHLFAKSLAEHNRNVRRYRKIRKEQKKLNSQ